MSTEETSRSIKKPPNISPTAKRVKTALLEDGRGRECQFYAGLLLFYGDTKVGKSTTALGIVYEAAFANQKASYLTLDEVGSLTGTPLTPINELNALDDKVDVDLFLAASAVKDKIPTATLINRYLTIIKNELVEGRPAILVLDSIGPSLAVSSGLLDQPAGKGGMVEGYGSYLRSIDGLAKKYGCTIVGVINASLFPVTALEGAADGAIELTGKGAFLKHDRTDRSNQTQYELHDDSIRNAIKFLEPTRGDEGMSSTSSRII